MKPLILFLSVLLIPAMAAGSGITGSLKTQASLIENHWSISSSRWLAQSSLRLIYDLHKGDISLSTAWTLIPSTGDPALQDADLEGSGVFRIDDPDRTIIDPSGDGTSFSLAQDLDRLNLRIRTTPATITVGRQAIFWGVAKTVSPTDFIAPFQYGSMDTEYRIGVDAFRAVFPVGMMSELDAGYVAGEDLEFSRSGCWLRGRFYAMRTDLSLLTACYRQNLMIGGSLNRSVGQGTGWVEAAFIRTGFFKDDDSDGASIVSLSAGYDRSWFNAALYGYLEYHFSSPGSDDPEDYAEVLQEAALSGSGIYLTGRHYLCPGITWSATPLFTMSCGSMVNLADPSAYIAMSGDYSAGENTTITAGVNLGLGRKPLESSDRMRSEFGSWPDGFFLRLAHYF